MKVPSHLEEPSSTSLAEAGQHGAAQPAGCQHQSMRLKSFVHNNSQHGQVYPYTSCGLSKFHRTTSQKGLKYFVVSSMLCCEAVSLNEGFKVTDFELCWEGKGDASVPKLSRARMDAGTSCVQFGINVY